MSRPELPNFLQKSLTAMGTQRARRNWQRIGIAGLLLLSCRPLLESVVDVFSFDDDSSSSYAGPSRIDKSVLAVVQAVDLDGDGADELLAIDSGQTQIVMIDGDGSSTEMWKGPEIAAVAWTTAKVSGGGTGHLLVMTTNRRDNVSSIVQVACEGTTCGGGREAATLPASTALATGDMNNDGVVDLLVRGEEDIFIILGEEEGEAGFELGTPQSQGSISAHAGAEAELYGVDRIEVADIDVDGSMDVIAVDRHQIAIFFGEGNGRLGEAQAVELSQEMVQFSPLESVHVASLDNSPYLDIIVDFEELSHVFRNTDGRSFRIMPPILNQGLATRTYPGNFRGSTTEVVVVAYFDGFAELATMNGDAWTTRRIQISTDYDYRVRNGVIADLDGNGSDEVVLVSPRREADGCQ